MIPAPLDDAAMAGERAMLQPAWLGRKPTNARPLTDEWYTGVTQPRYHADGSKTYVLTPPRGAADGAWLRLLPWLVLVASFVAAWRFYGWL